MGRHVINATLTTEGIKKLKQDLMKYKSDIEHKCEDLARILAMRGVEISRVKIAEHNAIFTSQLLSSMNYRRGSAITNGSEWIIYTDCPWAKFVEFGTGIVGSGNKHPNPNIANWKYDVNNHGESGWFYYKDGQWHHTKGMPSRPFMFETANDLSLIVVQTALEVFGR